MLVQLWSAIVSTFHMTPCAATYALSSMVTAEQQVRGCQEYYVGVF
jgi:hypothetical protein